MSCRRTREEIARHVELACLLEVAAPKPGNVNRYFDFDDATLEDFLASAVALGESFRRCERWTVGGLVLEGVAATRRLAGSNTNLGIVLLLAPLAMGALRAPRGSLREGTRDVLEETGAADARLVYEAIRLAAPGGLGRSDSHDVNAEAPSSLIEAMKEAASRDSVAREYASGYEYTFDIVLPSLHEGFEKGLSVPDSVVRTFLLILSRIPDTLIARKAGFEEARRISRAAGEVLDSAGPREPAGTLPRPLSSSSLEGFDALLRSRGNLYNPGTTADLVVSGLFALLSENPQADDRAVLPFRRRTFKNL